VTPQQKIEIDREAQALVRRVRKGNEDAARHGGKKLDDEQYTALEDELRQRLSRRARPVA
jgi:hypothetical protein